MSDYYFNYYPEAKHEDSQEHYQCRCYKAGFGLVAHGLKSIEVLFDRFSILVVDLIGKSQPGKVCPQWIQSGIRSRAGCDDKFVVHGCICFGFSNGYYAANQEEKSRDSCDHGSSSLFRRIRRSAVLTALSAMSVNRFSPGLFKQAINIFVAISRRCFLISVSLSSSYAHGGSGGYGKVMSILF